MLNKNNNIFDIAIIGAGPAGMMAGIRAGELGKKVVLIEKNQTPGKKLLLTGKGRCNITNAEFDNKKLAEVFGKKGRFLLSGFSVFNSQNTIDFFEKRGLKTKIERGKRVFPQSDKAKDVLNTLLKCLQKNKVKIIYGTAVKKFEKSNNQITSILLENNDEIVAAQYIICTGGKSYPGTGSDGIGFKFAKQLGHNIVKLRPGLVPLKIKQQWIKQAQGLSLKNVKLCVFQDNVKKYEYFGEMLFTHFGISGPIALDMSKNISGLLEKGKVYTDTFDALTEKYKP